MGPCLPRRIFKGRGKRVTKEGALVDKSLQVLLEGLSRAAAEPEGLPLFGARNIPGLFQASVPARLAASRCRDEGYLQVVRSETRGKRVFEFCAITDKGLAYLVSQVSPKKVLEGLLEVLRARSIQAAQLIQTAQNWQTELEQIDVVLAKVLRQLQAQSSPPKVVLPANGSAELAKGDPWFPAALNYLREREDTSSSDCPLPELYRQAEGTATNLTLGLFHDGLRKLHQQEKIFLHPWTGPLYEIPEPPYALLIGHEIAYYASARKRT
jgi:hypothetical protein